MPQKIARTFIGELKSLPLWLYAVMGLTAFGLGIAVYRLVVGLGTTTNLNHGYPWGLWIGFDLFVVAFSGGAFTLATLVYVFQMHEFHAATRPTVLTGLLGYVSVLIILVMDLGRWDRFYHFMIFPNINSALFEVSWCILLYTTVLISEFSPVFFQRLGWQRMLAGIKKITVPLVIIGTTLSTLHQSSLGSLFIVMSERLHPLWYTPLIPFFFFVSSIAAGLAMIVGGASVSFWVFKRSLPQKVVGSFGWFLPWVLGFYGIMKLGELVIAEEFGLLFTSGIYSVLFWTELVIGCGIPIILFMSKAVRHNRVWTLIGAVLVLFGIFLNRFDAAWFALKPVAGFAYFPHWMEIAIQFGVLSAMVVIYTLIGRYFPLFEDTLANGHAAEAATRISLSPAE
ncbi:MAG: Ni/Fe-hydrogenase cytochrome b subunit [Chloroflexi bacterium]|nr:Ni/Fe-hydrogenase cytochrome b subunit [Chloroflexota bacterium]